MTATELGAAPAQQVETVADKSAALHLELKRDLQRRLGINSRYAGDAILKANGVIAAQRALVPAEIAEAAAKRERTARKREASARKAERLKGAGRAEEATSVARAIRGQHLRLAKLDAKLAMYRRHLAEGTNLTVEFGGQRLWRLCRRAGAEHQRQPAQWQAPRRGRLYSRGDRSKGGNPNLRITLGQDGEFALSAAISHPSVKTGHTVYARQGSSQERDTHCEAPRVGGRLWVPRKQEKLLRELVLSGRRYTVEVLRPLDGRWRAHVSFIPTGVEPSGGNRGVVGIDLNPHRVGRGQRGKRRQPRELARGPGGAARGRGQPAQVRRRTAGGRGAGPDLATHRRRGRRTRIGRPTWWTWWRRRWPPASPAGARGPGIRQGERHQGRLQPIQQQLPTEAIDRQARRLGVPIPMVDPAYTPAEGRWRLAPDLGWSVHGAVALCIGRRAPRHHRRFSQRLRERLVRASLAV